MPHAYEPYAVILQKLNDRVYDVEDLIELSSYNPILFARIILKLPFKKFSVYQEKILETFYNPANNIRELVLVCGRKSGKSVISTIMMLYEVYKLLTLYDDPQKYFGLLPNAPIYCILVAPAKDQALDVGFQYARSLAENSSYLRQYIVNSTNEELEFDKHIIIRTQTSSSRSGRGFTTLIMLYDEIAWFIDRKGNLSGDAVYNALQPNLKPLAPMSRSVLLSSPAGKSGIFFELFRYGKPYEVIQTFPEQGSEPWRAVFQVPTWKMNPKYFFDCMQCSKMQTEQCSVDCPSFEMYKEFKRNPETFEQEYGAQFCDAVDAALSPESITKCATGEMINIEQLDKQTTRIISLDPATTGNKYALVMGHISGEYIVVDLVKYWRALDKDTPIQIKDVEDYIEKLYKNFNITHIVIDQYQSASTAQRLQEKGIPVFVVNATNKYNQQAAEYTIQRINSTKITYPREKALINELLFLQRKVSGKTVRYEAAVGAEDDIYDAMSRVVYTLETESGKEAHVS